MRREKIISTNWLPYTPLIHYLVAQSLTASSCDIDFMISSRQKENYSAYQSSLKWLIVGFVK